MRKNNVFLPYPAERGAEKSRTLMSDVIIALLPALCFAVYVFKFRALSICVAGIVGAIIGDALFALIFKRKIPLGDFSAIITGIIVSFTFPVAVPLWLPLAAGFTATGIKQLCGGIGRNLFNPAAASVVIFSAVFPDLCTRFTKISATLPAFTLSVSDSILNETELLVSATPLSLVKQGVVVISNLLENFYGLVPGGIGEVSVMLLAVGFLFLAVKRAVSVSSSFAYLGTMFILTFFTASGDSEPLFFTLTHIISGQTALACFFMCNDYTTVPYTTVGKVLFGAGAAALTVAIRYFTPLNDGAYIAVLMMNAFTPLFEKLTIAVPFGKPAKRTASN